MTSFAKQAKQSSDAPGAPPNAISGTQLDGNFCACLPVQGTGSNQPYKVKADGNGWLLEGMAVFDVCENGQPRQFRFFAQRV
jgi:hypothetical protein